MSAGHVAFVGYLMAFLTPAVIVRRDRRGFQKGRIRRIWMSLYDFEHRPMAILAFESGVSRGRKTVHVDEPTGIRSDRAFRSNHCKAWNWEQNQGGKCNVEKSIKENM